MLKEKALAGPAPVTDKLPSNDTDRLFFYTEVLIANIPSLIADLSSPKYTFLSFSEKTRTEVKQKSALIQSISRTYNNVLALHKQLSEKEAKLEKYEVELVTASPPRFLTSAEVLEAKRAASSNDGKSGGDGDDSFADGAIMVLNEEDIKPVRRAEEENRKETDLFTELCRTANEMEDTFAKARVKCEEMTQHVQSLKTKYDDLLQSLKRTQQERSMLATVRAEFEERQGITREAFSILAEMQTQCRHEELDIIQQSIKKAEEEVREMRHELAERQSKHEVELAAYQIAYKEAQAEAETLKDDVVFLKKHQKDLEVLAKQQQMEEASQNSLRNFVMKSLTWSASKDDKGKKALTSEQLAEVKADHALVSVLSANIAAMDEQRSTVAGILAQVDNAFDNDAVRVALQHIQEVLEPAITLDEDALNLSGA